MKTQQNPYGLKQNPKNSLDQNLTPKKSHTEFPSHKNFQRNYAAQIRGNYHESSDCFESPKKSLLKSSYPKNNLPKFSYPKKSRNRNFQTPKILRSSLSLQIRSTLPLRTRSWLNQHDELNSRVTVPLSVDPEFFHVFGIANSPWQVSLIYNRPC